MVRYQKVKDRHALSIFVNHFIMLPLGGVVDLLSDMLRHSYEHVLSFVALPLSA